MQAARSITVVSMLLSLAACGAKQASESLPESVIGVLPELDTYQGLQLCSDLASQAVNAPGTIRHNYSLINDIIPISESMGKARLYMKSRPGFDLKNERDKYEVLTDKLRAEIGELAPEGKSAIGSAMLSSCVKNHRNALRIIPQSERN